MAISKQQAQEAYEKRQDRKFEILCDNIDNELMNGDRTILIELGLTERILSAYRKSGWTIEYSCSGGIKGSYYKFS